MDSGNIARSFSLRERDQDQRDRGLDLQERTSDRNDLGENRRQVAGLRAPPTYMTKAIPLLSARKKMEQLRQVFNSGDIHPGPVTGRMQQLRDMLGVETEDTAIVISTLMDSLASFVLSKTGQQASAKEYAILASILPRLIDNPPAFKARLDNFIRIIDLDLDNFRDVGAGQSFDMSPIGGKKMTQFPNVTGLSGVNKFTAPAPQEGQVGPGEPVGQVPRPQPGDPDRTFMQAGYVKMRDPKGGRVAWGPPEEVESMKAKGAVIWNKAAYE